MTRIDLDTIADDIWSLIGGGYLTRIHALIDKPATHVIGDSGQVRTKVIGSPAPWNDEAAGILFEIHAGTRRHENALRRELAFNPIRRGPSDTQTIASLSSLPDLIRAITTRHLDQIPAERAARDITRWPSICRRILDDDPAPHERPNTKAPGGLCCPHCNRRLILKHGWQHATDSQHLWCIRCPTTIDDDHPRGRDLSWEPAAWIAVLQHTDTPDGGAA